MEELFDIPHVAFYGYLGERIVQMLQEKFAPGLRAHILKPCRPRYSNFIVLHLLK